MAKIKIVIPVYDGLEETRRCLSSVLASMRQQKNTVELVVINDASPNPAVTELLKNFAKTHDITLLENKENRGFVATINIGVKLDPDADVILLNSDTEVANNWVDRLVATANMDSTVGTVTPFSNNAEICSFPVICKSNKLPLGLSIEDIDKNLATFAYHKLVDLPTAVGFCMYIKRECLDAIGYFDEETFGRGYGEENDFCMRASNTGWRNVLSPNVFVFHKGGVSFSDEKAYRIEAAMKILDRIHPKYHGLVDAHIYLNPAKAHRLTALIHLYAVSENPTVLHISHNLSGGTAKNIDELCAHNVGRLNTIVLQKEQSDSLIIYFGDLEGESISFTAKQFKLLWNLLLNLGVSYIHLHHVMGIPEAAFDIIQNLNVPYYITLHDYYFINANPTLTDNTGRYCEDVSTRDKLCAIARPVPFYQAINSWRATQEKLLNNAQKVISPSQATKTIYEQYFSEVNFQVANHPDWEIGGAYPSVKLTAFKPGENFRILIIGAISREKGADMLEKTASMAAQKNYEFHLAGYAYKPLDSNVIEHGAYQDEDLPGEIERIDPHVIWFPCLWPETYSYTLSSALRSARPIVATAIGSFPERMAGRPYSWIIDWHTTAEEWVTFFDKLTAEHLAQDGEILAWQNQEICSDNTTFYKTSYVSQIEDAKKRDQTNASAYDITLPLIQLQLEEAASRTSANVGRKEKLLLLLMRLRANGLTGRIAKLIPFNMQREVKRLLSSDPLHDVVNRTKKVGK